MGIQLQEQTQALEQPLVKPLSERDQSLLTHIALGHEGLESRNRLMKTFKRAGAKTSVIRGELGVTYNNEVINFARGDVEYGKNNAFSRELVIMASALLNSR